jgi:O-antigen ligase
MAVRPRLLLPGVSLAAQTTLLVWLAAVLAAAGVALLVAGGSTAVLGVLLLGLMALGAVVWSGQPRRALIAALFFLAPIDISKALVAPLDQFYSPGLYLTPAHVVLLLLALCCAVLQLWHRAGWPALTRLDVGALVWLAWVVIRSLGSPQGDLALATAVSYGLAVLAFLIVSHALRDAADLRLVLLASLVVLGLQVLYAAAQMLTHAPLALPGSKGLAEVAELTFGGEGLAFRPTGFFGHPNALADHLSLVLPPLLALLLLGRQRLARATWWWVLAGFGAAALMQLLTLSRSGWLVFVLSAAMVCLMFVRVGLMPLRRLAALGLAALALLLLIVVVYPQAVLRLTAPDDRSLESRVLLNDQATTIIQAQPWVGVGFGGYNRAAHEFIGPRFATVSADYQQQLLTLVVHNHYLLLAAELGLPALLFFLLWLLRVILLPWPLARWRDPGSFALASGLSAAMLAQLVFLSADNFYADTRVFMIWLTAGLLQALVLTQAPSGPRAVT